MNKLEEDIEIRPFRQIEHEYIGYQSLTDVPKVLEYSELDKDVLVKVSFLWHYFFICFFL
jgi:hypothetical protein